MGSLVLMVVAAIWVAVLVPPLLRSRLENRPNSSVTDFRNQLSSLQRAMPTGRSASMRGMARPLAPVSIARPPASARPLRSGVSLSGGGTVRSAGQQAAMRPAGPDLVRTADPAGRGRSHASDARRSTRRPRPSAPAPRDARKQRRANVLFVLALTAACTVFLAATADSPGMTALAVGACAALAGYVVMLAQQAPRPPARRPAAARRRAPVEDRRAPVEEWYEDEEPVAPVRRRQHHPGRDHRTEHVARPAARPRRDGYDPTPSGLVYGEPDLSRGHPRPARRASSRGHRTIEWSPA